MPGSRSGSLAAWVRTSSLVAVARLRPSAAPCSWWTATAPCWPRSWTSRGVRAARSPGGRPVPARWWRSRGAGGCCPSSSAAPRAGARPGPRARGPWGERMPVDAAGPPGSSRASATAAAADLGGCLADVTVLLPGGRGLHTDVRSDVDTPLRYLEELRTDLKQGRPAGRGAGRFLLDRLRGRVERLRDDDRKAAATTTLEAERDCAPPGDARPPWPPTPTAPADRLVEGARAPQLAARAGARRSRCWRACARPSGRRRCRARPTRPRGAGRRRAAPWVRIAREACSVHAAEVAALAVGRPASRVRPRPLREPAASVLGGRSGRGGHRGVAARRAGGAGRPVVLVAGQLVAMERRRGRPGPLGVARSRGTGYAKPAMRSWLTSRDGPGRRRRRLARRQRGEPPRCSSSTAPSTTTGRSPRASASRASPTRRPPLREVEEETGFTCHLGPELAVNRYIDRKGRPKAVRYWVMTRRRRRVRAPPDDEVDEVLWLRRSARPRRSSATTGTVRSSTRSSRH